MLNRNDIKNVHLVYNSNTKRYGIIECVGNAIEKGDRDQNTFNKMNYLILCEIY